MKTYKYTDLFRLIPKLTKENLITEKEKMCIKEYVIKNEPDLSKEFEQFKIDNDKTKLAEALKSLIKTQELNFRAKTFVARCKKDGMRTLQMKGKPQFKLPQDSVKCYVDDDFLGSPKVSFTRKKTFFSPIIKESDDEDENK